MPQGSLFSQYELNRLEINLVRNEVECRTEVSLRAFNRAGQVLSAAAVTACSVAEAELLPELLLEAAYGWLYKDARDATVACCKDFRERKRSLCT